MHIINSEPHLYSGIQEPETEICFTCDRTYIKFMDGSGIDHKRHKFCSYICHRKQMIIDKQIELMDENYTDRSISNEDLRDLI